MPSLQYLIVFVTALIPAIIWLYFFLRQHQENKWLVLFTFIGGMIAAKLILVYQGYWNETVNFIFFKVSLVDFRNEIETLIINATLALFVVFLGVGVMEEFIKFIIMRLVNQNFFRSIDDVIQLAIISALGFAFFENIVYFLSHWDQLSAWGFLGFALFRVTIVAMVHMLCSGVLGYYYGMAFFASPMLKIQEMKKVSHPILHFLKRVFHMKRSAVYHDEMFLVGLISAMFLHAIYDFLLSVKIGPLIVPVMLVYFFGGFWYLNLLFKKKDLNLKLGLVGTSIMPKEDFENLLHQVQEIKERMQSDIEKGNAKA